MLKVRCELVLIGILASTSLVAGQGQNASEEEGKAYILDVDKRIGEWNNKRTTADWNYESNLTTYNSDIYTEIGVQYESQWNKQWNATVTYPWKEYQDYDVRRMFSKYSDIGTSALPEEEEKELIQAISNMQDNYATATICDYNNSSKCDLTVEPGVTDIFAQSQNPDELKSAWVQWHHAAGIVSKGNFTKYVELNNKAVQVNGYNSTAEWWLSKYETSDSEEQFLTLWQQVRPLYLQMHAYVRSRLRNKYGDNVVSKRGPIPAHLLGDIWASTWTNVENFSTPYPDKAIPDITTTLVAQNYTAKKMFEMADVFFQSINLTAMPERFWEYSIIEKPTDGRDLVCHPSAWDFFNGTDFRIKQCTTITSSFFTTTHHEMGHIQYYIQYKDLPQIYREGPNPGFQEAVGDTIALSVATPKHLRLVGLMDEGTDDEETAINQLYRMALDKVVFLPFGYMLDIYRYGIFRGTTTPDEYNCHFWAIREALQGVEPPVTRTEDDFDAAAKYHVSADVEYMRYYIAYIIQFQFHRALCELAGEYGGSSSAKLSACDIYNSTAAGNAFGEMLRLGSSKPWPDAMEALTGQRNMSASGILEYFQPLQQWLVEENEKNGEYIGWDPSTVQYCTEEQVSNNEASGFTESLDKFTKNSTVSSLY